MTSPYYSDDLAAPLTCICGHAPEDHGPSGSCEIEEDIGQGDERCDCPCYEPEDDSEPPWADEWSRGPLERGPL